MFNSFLNLRLYERTSTAFPFREITNSLLFLRCLSSCSRQSGIGIVRTEAVLFGDVIVSLPPVRNCVPLICITALSRSISFHFKAQSSPMRRPVYRQINIPISFSSVSTLSSCCCSLGVSISTSVFFFWAASL
mgnify:CR=1 FL=1